MSRRLLAPLAVGLAALGLLARSGSVLPAGLDGTLAAAGRAATPGAAAALALATVVGAALLVRGRLDGDAPDPAAAFRPRRAPDDDLPLLGADVAGALDRIAAEGPGADPADRETVRTAVEDAGVTVLARAADVDRETARRRFRRGDWTRDPAVAAYCGADVAVPLRTRLTEALAPEPRFVRRTRSTIDALAGVAGAAERGSDGTSTSGPASARRGGGRR